MRADTSSSLDSSSSKEAKGGKTAGNAEQAPVPTQVPVVQMVPTFLVAEPLSRVACLLRIQETVRELMSHEKHVLVNLIAFRGALNAALSFTEGEVREVLALIGEQLDTYEATVQRLGAAAHTDWEVRTLLASMQTACNMLTSVNLWRIGRSGGWATMPKATKLKPAQKAVNLGAAGRTAQETSNCISVHLGTGPKGATAGRPDTGACRSLMDAGDELDMNGPDAYGQKRN